MPNRQRIGKHNAIIPATQAETYRLTLICDLYSKSLKANPRSRVANRFASFRA